jgi:hypothetical protein
MNNKALSSPGETTLSERGQPKSVLQGWQSIYTTWNTLPLASVGIPNPFPKVGIVSLQIGLQIGLQEEEEEEGEGRT